MQQVLLGLSGGVDSAVAALLLREQGYDITGCYLDNGLPGAEAARRAASELNIPLVEADIREDLERLVCAPFAEYYSRGETPSPCIFCNRSVKFPRLLQEADRLGIEKIATGHYARCREGRIYKAVSSNDQSYMLCRLLPEQAGRLLLPLGGWEKPLVRERAGEARLAAARKPDSMEICFIPDGDYAAWMERRGVCPKAGNLIYEGKPVGRHEGIHHYTVGQRRHLGVALGKPVYVAEIRPDTGDVILADADDVYCDRLRFSDLSRLVPEGLWPREFTARVRHSRSDTPAGFFENENTVRFSAPVRAATPGQAVAFYDGDLLLGGAFIRR